MGIAVTHADTPRRALRTVDAARYLGISPSLLRKMRGRGPDDPAGQGPEFVRLSPCLIVYEIRSLDNWFEKHRATAAAQRGTVAASPVL
jgi:hypothetical protein